MVYSIFVTFKFLEGNKAVGYFRAHAPGYKPRCNGIFNESKVGYTYTVEGDKVTLVDSRSWKKSKRVYRIDGDKMIKLKNWPEPDLFRVSEIQTPMGCRVKSFP